MRDSGNPSRSVRVVLEVDPLVHATLGLSERIRNGRFESDGAVDNRLDRCSRESFLLELRLPRILTADGGLQLLIGSGPGCPLLLNRLELIDIPTCTVRITKQKAL